MRRRCLYRMLSAPTSTDLLLLAYETRCPPVTTPQGGCASAGLASRWPASQPVPLLLTTVGIWPVCPHRRAQREHISAGRQKQLARARGVSDGSRELGDARRRD